VAKLAELETSRPGTVGAKGEGVETKTVVELVDAKAVFRALEALEPEKLEVRAWKRFGTVGFVGYCAAVGVHPTAFAFPKLPTF